MQKVLGNKYLTLFVMAVTWGSSFILIKKTLPVFNPLQIGAFRVGFSGLLLFFIGFKALRKLPKQTILWIAIAGLFGNFLPLFMFPYAQTRVSSSLAGMINALEPVFTLILALLFFGSRSRLSQIIGAALGFIGAAVLLYLSDSRHSENYLFYSLILVLAAAFYALSALIVQEKLPHVPAIQLSSSIYSLWMLPSLVILVFSGFFTQIDFHSSETWHSFGYLLFLTVISTTLAMFLFYKLIQDTTAVFASSVSFLIPVIAVIWGMLDGESFVVGYALGGVFILIGIYLIGKKPILKS